MNEMISGVRSDVAAILYGDDLDLMVAKASEVEHALRSIRGAEEVKAEQVSGQPLLQIRVKQDEIARYGISASTIMNIVRALSLLVLRVLYVVFNQPVQSLEKNDEGGDSMGKRPQTIEPTDSEFGRAPETVSV